MTMTWQVSGLPNTSATVLSSSNPVPRDTLLWACPQVRECKMEECFIFKMHFYKACLSWYNLREKVTCSTIHMLDMIISIFSLHEFVISCVQEARHWGVTRSWLSITRVETSPLNMWRLLTWMSMLVSHWVLSHIVSMKHI